MGFFQGEFFFLGGGGYGELMIMGRPPLKIDGLRLAQPKNYSWLRFWKQRKNNFDLSKKIFVEGNIQESTSIFFS